MSYSAGNADVHYMSEPVRRTLEVLVGKDTDMLQVGGAHGVTVWVVAA